jgi:hypothetical protein
MLSEKCPLFLSKTGHSVDDFINFFSKCKLSLLFFNLQSHIFALVKSQNISINLKLNKKW